MESKKHTAENGEATIDLVEKARSNKKAIIGAAIAVVAVAAIAIVWYLVAQNGSRKADEAIGRADIEMNDSIATQLYAEAATFGYRSGNRAKAEMGIRLYRDGEYAKAVEYLSDCSLDDEVAAAGVKVLEGDCYVNLEQYDKAISCYNSAISKANENPAIVPFVLVKEANVYRAQGKYSDEAKAYKKILDEYPAYNPQGVDIRSLYERANAAQ